MIDSIQNPLRFRFFHFLIPMIIALLGTSSYGQLLRWNTYANLGTETTEPSTFNNTNINPSDLSLGIGILPQANANRFGGVGWFDTGNTAAGSTLAQAIAGNNYIQFTVMPKSGYSFTLTALNFYWDTSATGPKNLALRSSIDNYTTNLAVVAPYSGAIVTENTFTITALANISTPTTFRIYGYGATSAIGTGGLDVSNNSTNVQLNGTTACFSSVNTISPSTGPGGTEVTITATVNDLIAATASLNGTALAVTQISPTKIKVVVPPGANSGNITTTNNQGCTTSNAFTVLQNSGSGCQGGNVASDLFISEVTDATAGGLTYVELYNGTGTTVNLAAYSLKIAFNGAAYTTTVALNNFNLLNGRTYVVSLGSDNACSVPGGSGSFANQVGPVAAGINYIVGQNDHIGLFKNTTLIDSFGVFGSVNWADGLGLGDRGATFRRKNTVVAPKPVFNAADWNINNWEGTGTASCSTNDYSDIGFFNFLSGLPPTITRQPSFVPSCESTTLKVVATEGFPGGNPLAYQWFVLAPTATNWVAVTNSAVYSGATTETLSINNLVGLHGYQYYAQVRENGLSCYTASATVKVEEPATVTWNGIAWSPSPPSESKIAVINGNYNTAANGSFDSCNLIIKATKNLMISPSQYVTVQNNLTVEAGASLTVQTTGSLIMANDTGIVTNAGTMKVEKTTSSFEKNDYIYWSSPVIGSTIGSVFSEWRTDYSFTFNTANFIDLNNDSFDDALPSAWTNTGTAAIMVPGKGYAIRTPSSGTFPRTANVLFNGKFNNGLISVPLALSGNAANANDDFNLIGNPYPSAISATAFIQNNPTISGTLYFWTHVADISPTNPGPNALDFTPSDYALFNLTGGTRASLTGSAFPLGFIASCQGFMVEAVTASNVVFKNGMRSKAYPNTQFFRNSNQVLVADEGTIKNRIWLNLKNAEGLFSQQLIGYSRNTTTGIDQNYDGRVKPSRNFVSFYSLIDGEPFRIQARSNFNDDDVVPLGYFSAVAGLFTIGIDQVEGVLKNANTQIFLEDKQLNIIHDLKQEEYVFTTEAGTFDNRFALRYNNILSTDTNSFPQNTVVVAADTKLLKIKSSNLEIESVVVYNISGRVIYNVKKVNNLYFEISGINRIIQTLIVQVKMTNGTTVSKKILF